MNDCITRELAEERLMAKWGHVNALTNRTLDILFPPPFCPKEDEVYAYTATNGETKYIQHGKGTAVHGARPQTDKEKGI